MQRWGRTVGFGVVAFLVHIALARAALEWDGDLRPIPLWLATASTVAIALYAGRTHWFAVVLGGALIGNLATGFWLFDESVRSVLAPGLSVLIEVVLAIWLLDRILGSSPVIRRTRISLLVLCVCVAAAAVGATIATVDTASPVVSTRPEAWVRWALGDLVGLLILVPLAGVGLVPDLAPAGTHRKREAVLTVVAVTIVVYLSFTLDVSIIYLVLPAVIWAAIRFGPRLVAPLALLVVVASTFFTGRDYGPFADRATDAVVQVQGFNLAVALCSLVAGAHAVRAWNDQQQLAALLRTMPDAAALTTSDGRLLSSWIPRRLREAGQALIVPNQSESRNPIDHVAAGSVSPSDIVSVAGQKFEHRSTSMPNDRELHIYREITNEDRGNRRWRHLEASGHESVVEVDKELLVTAASPNFVAGLGAKPEDVIGQRFDLLFDARNWGDESDAYLERVLGGESVRFERRDHIAGRDLWTVVAVEPELDSAGVFDGCTMFLLDTTHLHEIASARAEADLARASAEESERARIGLALHDGALQDFSAARLMLEAKIGRLAPDEDLARIHALVSEALQKLRVDTIDLAPDETADIGIAEALRRTAQRLSFRGGPSVEVVDDGIGARSGGPLTALYLVAREALVNSIAHSNGQSIVVNLEASEDQGVPGYVVTVQDDGVGFDIEQHVGGAGHLGLRSMEDRSERAGGWCAIESPLGAGTVVTAWVPS